VEDYSLRRKRKRIGFKIVTSLGDRQQNVNNLEGLHHLTYLMQLELETASLFQEVHKELELQG
jgi:hypothetical protein